MSRDVWVISDTHFNHENILKFSNGRGDDFSSVKEMNECMIDNWNSVVKKGDLVYHLGDVFFGNKGEFHTLWKKLNGAKRLIVGNHDDVKFLARGEYFQKIMLWRMFPEFNAILTHLPMHESNMKIWGDYDEDSVNIHGHIHRNPAPSSRHKCVSVEQINYTPILLGTT